jgi:hypothetical protein
VPQESGEKSYYPTGESNPRLSSLYHVGKQSLKCSFLFHLHLESASIPQEGARFPVHFHYTNITMHNVAHCLTSDIIIIIIGKTALFELQPSLEDSARSVHPVSTSLDFATVIFLQSNVSLASNAQPGGPGLCLCPPVTGWPSYTPRHRVPFSSPSTTRRAMVEAF